MKTRIGTLRETFDRDMNFVAVKPFRLNGAQFGPGQSFDKTLVTTRRLRQLHDGRYLRMVEPDRPVIREERAPVRVEIGNMHSEPQTRRVKRVKLQQAAE